MPFDLSNFNDSQLDTEYVTWLIDQQAPQNQALHSRLWDYYRNPLVPSAATTAGVLNENSRPYFLAQEVGLPARITGVQRLGAAAQATDLRRKEVVIENDIAWRVQTMVDYLVGRPVVIRSLAGNPDTARAIEQVLDACFDANGGVSLLQEMSLFASVYGFVDVALRSPAHPLTAPEDTRDDSADARSNSTPTRAITRARQLRLETVEARRIVPLLADDDYRTCRYWMQRYHRPAGKLAAAKRNFLSRSRSAQTPDHVEVVEILSPTFWQRYENRQLVAEGSNPLQQLPVVHIQNLPQPGSYAGLSDVEPLIPLQDELNTRLSDRAHRVTYQSFKMYLGKGIDDFLERPVGPGQMWATQNLAASIEEFGRDDGSPSEDIHIDQVRRGLDKASGVTPIAAGLIRGEAGQLSSAAALRVVLSGLLAKTARKRLTFAKGVADLSTLILAYLDRTGVMKTRVADRKVEIHWPEMLPSDEHQTLRNAQIKQSLGVPSERLLAELGYLQP